MYSKYKLPKLETHKIVFNFYRKSITEHVQCIIHEIQNVFLSCIKRLSIYKSDYLCTEQSLGHLYHFTNSRTWDPTLWILNWESQTHLNSYNKLETLPNFPPEVVPYRYGHVGLRYLYWNLPFIRNTCINSFSRVLF